MAETLSLNAVKEALVIPSSPVRGPAVGRLRYERLFAAE